MAFNLVVLGG